MHDYQRPPTLYRYGIHEDLELALTQGQFILTPAASCLTLSFSQVWEPRLFELFAADSCLIIHNTEEFGERVHRAVQRALPSWAGIDGAVEYGVRAALGAAFSKTAAEAPEQEWQFAWRAMQANLSLNPVLIKVGSLENFAELRKRDTYLA
ncbi:hypothetical protein GTP23_14945 [Pseudoduganella sp. FT93W]|uniref:Uncharacterized protein n=1 Tax=Duganella fentianensis TaxID=2692177 RepID=A0A845I2L3_9BURK|nr:hypothetical protein [Duganella fentianensis]MYN46347.1 hypothetical protein [Duganella fentianensis]